MKIIDRFLTPHILHSLETDRVTALMGPRQAGKTTLVNHLLKTARPIQYYNLKDPDIRRILSSSARQEFLHYQNHIIVLDEVQRIPSLLELIQLQVDRYPERKGQFLLLGSNHLLLNRQIRESLAGRVALFTLLPLSFTELLEENKPTLLSRLITAQDIGNIPEILDQHYVPADRAVKLAARFAELNIFGGYPEFLTRKDPDDRRNWLNNYHQTYLDTDLRELVHLRNPESFERFEKLFVQRAAALLNVSELARDCGLTADSIRRFLNYYRQLFVAWPCLPLHVNLGKRMMKMPKWYFHDTGLLRSVAGDFREDVGAYFENTVLSELQKWFFVGNPRNELFFARTATGIEADAVFSSLSGRITFFAEVKRAQTAAKGDIRHLKKFVAAADDHAGILINNGTAIEELAPRIWSLPAAWLFY